MLSSPDAVLRAGAAENRHGRRCRAGAEVSSVPSRSSEGCEAGPVLRSIGTASPVSRSGSLTWGTAGNAPTLPGQGLCPAMKTTSQGTGSAPCQRPPYPSPGAAAEEQRSSLQLSSSAWSQLPGKLLGLRRMPSFRQDDGHG